MLKAHEMSINSIPGSRFTRNGSQLTAWASDFGPVKAGTFWLQRLYNDACDVGIAIRGNQRTVRFVLGHTEYREGDLVAWHFAPVDDAAGIGTVTIYND